MWLRPQVTCVLSVAAVAMCLGQFVAASDELGAFTVTVGVELSCPSCASGLERRLGRLDNVAVVDIQPDEQRVVLGATSGTKVDLQAVRDVIRNAGFIPSSLHVTVVGCVVELDGGIGIALSEDTVVMVVEGENTRAEHLSQALGQQVLVRGAVPTEATANEEVLHLSEFEIQQ